MTETAQYRDGNALAGMFAEAFGVDMSTATVTCNACGSGDVFANARVYDRGPGMIMHCPSCGEIVARIVRTPTDFWLDLRGSTSWRIALPT